MTLDELSILINDVAEVNLVTCPNCGTIATHETGADWEDELKCVHCKWEYPLRERPDLFY